MERTKRILIVGHTKRERDRLSNRLSKAGYQVNTASNEPDVWEWLGNAEVTFDLLLCSNRIERKPNVGFKVLLHLRSIERYKDIPFVLHIDENEKTVENRAYRSRAFLRYQTDNNPLKDFLIDVFRRKDPRQL